MWVVRFRHETTGTDRVSRSRYRIRKWHTEAEAQAFADKIERRRGISMARPVELPEPPKVRAKPEGVLTWAKWTLQRSRVRFGARRRGMVRTSGDRTYNSLASVSRISDHWVEATDSWAEDFWHPDPAVMHDYADALRRRGGLKQVLVHDAGSGLHLHVAGWA